MDSIFNNREDYLAKWLSGELSTEERRAFEQSEEAKEYMDIINSIDKLRFPSYNVEAELAKLKAAQSQLVKIRSITPVWKFAVAAMLILGISLVYYLTRPNYEVFKTTYGELQTITLPDNSVVTLNVNSTLKFDPETFDESRVLILDGEAFFEVTKGIDFKVTTTKGTVTVLGTSFNVNQRKKNLAVQVYSGVVRVASGKVERVLEKGDGLRLVSDSSARFWNIEVDEKPKWLTSNLVELRDVPLEEAIESLRNSFGIDIQSNISLNLKFFSGSYPANNEEVAIQIVLSTAKIEYQYDSNAKKLKLIGFTEN